MSAWVATHLPCPTCGSSDAYSINDRGWGKCFSCGRNFKVGEEPTRMTEVKSSKSKELVPFGEYRALTKRGITEETCRKFGYFVTKHNGKTVQVAPYQNAEGQTIAQKLRTADKKFSTTGDFKNVVLFGQRLWQAGGKRLVITEGEIDCLSVSQVQGNKWPVVSVPNGAQGAVNAVKKSLEWVCSFDEVVIMFDEDEPGQEAAVKVAELLPPGKAKIATLPAKDANELLQQGRGQEIITAIWQAREYRPDGLVTIDDLFDEIAKPIEMGLPWCFPTLTSYTYGRRYGEVYGFGAGTGIGKTDLLTQQIAFDVKELGEKVGVIFLEQRPVETGKRIAGKIDGVRYHVPGAEWNEEQLKTTLNSLRDKVIFYDSWGETEWSVIQSKIRYMAVALGVRIFYVDHLTAMADTSNERESLEQIMKEMAGLANELEIIIHFVSHLATPEGKPHEEGGRVAIRHFKGSRAIGFWSYFLFGLERDQQAEDEDVRQTTTFRILKDRYTGQSTGRTILLGYDVSTGRLFEKDSSEQDDYGFTDESEDYGDAEDSDSSQPWDEGDGPKPDF
ncbi:toprim domain-containing protein [Candidatus Saccharibacteria bacterium]|nr:toprim domain-containing protein [Candidatus Saccharibacteria bacterium]